MADCLVDCSIDRQLRTQEKSSDHTVLIAKFKDKQ
jgi:hypothetical protein